MIKYIINKLETKDYRRVGGKHLNSICDKNVIWTELNTEPILSVLTTSEQDANLNFNLEDYMLALPRKYLYAYLAAAIMNIFHPKRSPSFIYDSRSLLDYNCITIIDIIKEVLIDFEDEIYYIKVDDIYLPWNDYIMTWLAATMYKKDIKTGKDEFKKPDYYEDAEIRPVVHDLIHKHSEFLNMLKSSKNHDFFMNKTQDIAVSINGTACVGKTNLLQELQNEIIDRYDSTCRIEKIGKYGGFRGKDNNQILALAYQAVIINRTNRNCSNVFDRDPFNNLIWRCILGFVKTYDDLQQLEDEIVSMLLQSISKNLIKTMQQYPVIILIDNDIKANRERMFKRATGGDCKRCFITSYVSAQNLFYCFFAYMCNWPVFDTGFKRTDRDTIKRLVLQKVSTNSRNPTTKIPDINHMVSFKTTYAENFKAAKRLRIMK